MSKRIAVFCDGTWNSADMTERTNVHAAYEKLAARDASGGAQIGQYHAGVGSTWNPVDRLGGGAFGWGLDQILADAYRALAHAYSPGDHVYLFGFSRGAYTARSLAGLIRSSGIPNAKNIARIPDAIARYRRRDSESHPDHEHSLVFRSIFSPHCATSEKEANWRRVNGSPPFVDLRIAYVGVWDTVGALGVPNDLGIARFFNGKYAFHDTQLSSFVSSARHAVAIDERRATFPPTLWHNVDTLNGTDVPRSTGPRYQQLWFPGDHGSVGGGGEIRSLSDEALAWIVDGAVAMDLAFESTAVADWRAGADHKGPLRNTEKRAGFFGRILQSALTDREGPAFARGLSASAVARMNEPASNLPDGKPYKTPPLAHL